MNSKSLQQKLLFELLWWLITAVVIAIFVWPAYQKTNGNFPFLEDNIMFLVVAITFGRYIFLIKYHWLDLYRWAKVIFIFIPIPIFFILLDSIYEVQKYIDVIGFSNLLMHLHHNDQRIWSKFIRTELFILWSAAFIANFIMPFRMLYSLSRSYRDAS